MSQLIGLIKALTVSFRSPKDLGEAYRSESADLSNLECRKHLVDIAARDNARSLIFGTMMPWRS